MNKLVVIISLGLILSFISCEKEEPFNQHCKLLKEVILYSINGGDDSNSFYEYVYEKNKLIKRILYQKLTYSSFDTTASLSIRVLIDSIIYNPEGKVFEIFHYQDVSKRNLLHERFFYHGNKINRIAFINYFYNDAILSYGQESYYYSDEGRLIQSEKATTYNSGKIKLENKSYNYIGWNLSRIDNIVSFSMDTNYGDPHSLEIDTNSYNCFDIFDNYDGMKNPYKDFFMLDDFRNKSLSENNYKYYYSEYHDGLSNSQTLRTDSIPVYNEYDFPTIIGYTELIYDCN